MSPTAAQPPESFDPSLGPRLAERLAESEPEIVDAWTRAVRSDPLIESDRSLSYPEFIDHIPKVLHELCMVLRAGAMEAQGASIRAEARVHGAFRWRQGYDMAELMREIGHLRAVVLDRVARLREDEGFPHAERPELERLVLHVIDEGQVATISTYIQERDRELAERDREIALRDGELQERDRRLHASLLQQERNRVEALESAARAKDEFLATLSHELRTPLTPILAWTTILDRDGSPATIAAAVKTIGRNAGVLLQLIDDLLDVSRIVAGKLECAREILDAREPLRAARDTLLPAAQAKRVTLRLIEPAEPLWIRGDSTRLQQLLWNLLSNAVKFSDPGHEVRLELARGDGDVRVSVSDDGAGIEADLLPHIFDRFRQGDQRSTRAHGGLGLGLAIASAVAEAHGGRLTASSVGLGGGSCFELRLPALPEEPAASG